MSKELIFISFSKMHTNKVGEVFKTILERLYENKNVEVFLSSESILHGDNFRSIVSEKLSTAKCGISLLSAENKLASPWLMYEAGALDMKVRENGGKLFPFLFCREREDVESPLTEIQAPQYQPQDHNNLEDLTKYFNSINATLSEENRVDDIPVKISRMWSGTDNIKLTLEKIAIDINNSSLSSHGENSSNSTINDSLGLHSMETEFQDKLSLIDSFTPKFPREIEDKFENMIKTQLPKKWLVQNDDDLKYNVHRVIVNNTRFSTFVAFTDEKRILLFDRNRDNPNTNVFNDRYDVFGSVQFQNRTIKNKIKNEEFMNEPILKIEEINGIAIESNKANKVEGVRETAVMLGLCIYMSPKSLDMAIENTKNEELILIPFVKAFDIARESLTSKASLAITHCLNKLMD